MSADIVPFPSRRSLSQDRNCRRQHPTPSGHIIKIIGHHRFRSEHENLFHQRRAGNNRAVSALDLGDVRLAATEFRREPALGPAFSFTPRRQFQCDHSRSGTARYCHGLYFVNGHKQFAGPEYKQMAYIYVMHPGNRIRELRKQAKLSQMQLAELTGVSQPAISQLENDGLSLTVEWMRSFARVFGVTPADILGDGDNPGRLSDEEQALIDQFRSAAPSQREMIRRVAEPLPDAAAPARRAA